MGEGVKASTCPLAVLSRCRGALPPARPLAFGIPHQSPGRLGAHQDGGDDARLRATHAPGMVGPSLDKDVALFQELLALVQDGVDLALEHDDVVDGRRGVPYWIARLTVGRAARADPREGGLR